MLLNIIICAFALIGFLACVFLIVISLVDYDELIAIDEDKANIE